MSPIRTWRSCLVRLKRQIQESEVKRVILCHLIHEQSNKQQKGNANEKQDKKLEGELKQLACHFVNLAGAMDKIVNAEGEQDRPVVDLHIDTQRYGIVETLGWLLVMAFLARKD